MKQGRILLCGRNVSVLSMIYNELSRELDVPLVLVEEKRPLPSRIAGRIRRKGIKKVFGQVLFSRLVLAGLRRQAKPIREEIIESYRLGTGEIDTTALISVPSINHPTALECFCETGFSAAALFGTSIMTAGSLDRIGLPLVNLHLGLSRYYRGLNCTYWALVDGRPEACGVTVHLVEKGLDSGPILAEKKILPDPGDNFAVYDFRNLAEGIPLLRKTLAGICEKGLPEPGMRGKGVLRTTPTLAEYLHNKETAGIT
ncbi:MAG: formyltransferase family protein [Thermovirgaceae bacterium]